MNKDRLQYELETTLTQIDAQIQAVKNRAIAMQINPYVMEHPDGKLVLSDLLCAKAIGLSALINIQDKETE